MKRLMTPPPVIRFALRDTRTGDLYPLPACPRWTDAYCVLEACRAGDDTGLPVPPPRGAALQITELLWPEVAARRAAESARRRAHIDAEVAALFGPPVPEPPDPALPAWMRLSLALMEGLRRLTGPVCILALLYYVPVWLAHHGLLPFPR